MMIKVKIKKLSEEAIVPSYSKVGDAGMDLTAIGLRVTDEFLEYKTGLAVEIPEGYVGLIFPRSSISKYNLVLANSVGVIDSGYRGELLIRFKMHHKYNQTEITKLYKVGERVAQLMILPYPQVNFFEVEELNETDRGAGGFGHSGK